MTLPQPIEILLVEDNPGDVLLTTEALAASRVDTVLTVVGDGEAAVGYLTGDRETGRAAARPDLVLLDLNLPRKSGHEVLEDIKGDPALVSIPVVVLSTSTAQADIDGSYERHASCYVSKPTTLDEYSDTMRSIEDFWLSTVRLPSR
jgi:two-component system, chemotaxis family, response regulator Rcp1